MNEAIFVLLAYVVLVGAGQDIGDVKQQPELSKM